MHHLNQHVRYGPFWRIPGFTASSRIVPFEIGRIPKYLPRGNHIRSIVNVEIAGFGPIFSILIISNRFVSFLVENSGMYAGVSTISLKNRIVLDELEVVETKERKIVFSALNADVVPNQLNGGRLQGRDQPVVVSQIKGVLAVDETAYASIQA